MSLLLYCGCREITTYSGHFFAKAAIQTKVCIYERKASYQYGKAKARAISMNLICSQSTFNKRRKLNIVMNNERIEFKNLFSFSVQILREIYGFLTVNVPEVHQKYHTSKT